MGEATKQSEPAAIDLSKRDLTLDLARVFCVLLVVVIHLLMTGVIVDDRGGIGLQRTLEMQPWYAHATWIGQIMPLFFLIGGFAGLTSWRGVQRRGGDAPAYVTSRLLRLARPAFPLFVFYVVAIGAGLIIVMTTGLLGFQVLDGVIIGVGSPLWFIAAYAISQALLPFLARMHTVAPRRTVLVLLGGVILVDALRYTTTEALGELSFWLGLLNLLFVWPLIQQFGFWYADGFFDRPWWQLVLIALGGFGMLWPLTTFGPYAVDMLVNQNPPTLPLVAIGLAQAALLRLLKPPLSALMRTRPAQAVVFTAGKRLITIYLWHVPMIVLVAGLALLIPGASPRPGSAEWWWSRPIEFVILLALLFALSFLVGRFEQPRALGSIPSLRAVVAATALVAAVPIIMIPPGLDFALAVAGVITFGSAILILDRWRVEQRQADALTRS
jgi:fucose 4-O-acetylase-like acetyltransferase